MSLSRPTRDRLVAAGAAALVILIAFSVVLIAKSCNRYTVTYYVGEEIVRTESVKKGDIPKNQPPKEIPEGKSFEYWTKSDGTQYYFNEPITKDLKLYAKFSDG